MLIIQWEDKLNEVPDLRKPTPNKTRKAADNDVWKLLEMIISFSDFKTATP